MSDFHTLRVQKRALYGTDSTECRLENKLNVIHENIVDSRHGLNESLNKLKLIKSKFDQLYGK